MDLLDIQQVGTELEVLAGRTGKWCVSIYLPTHRIVAGKPQDPIRFKNQLHQAADRLKVLGVRNSELKSLLAPAEDLLNHSVFWQHQFEGLALFLAEDFFRYYKFPLQVRELVVVAERFHLKPFFPLITRGKHFYILALSANSPRLYYATPYHVHEIRLSSLPRGLEDALRYDDLEQQLQFHTRAPKAKGNRAAVFHGQGVGIDDSKDRLLRYFRKINSALHDFLGPQHNPLVLAGVDYYRPIYREANTYPGLIQEGIPGNPENVNPQELRNQAMSLVEPYLQKGRHEIMARYQELIHTRRTSVDLKEILQAAHQGRVESLFVAVGVQFWGKFYLQEDKMALHEVAASDDEDLLDEAAVQTFLNGGSIYAVQAQEIPDEAPLAALFRY